MDRLNTLIKQQYKGKAKTLPNSCAEFSAGFSLNQNDIHALGGPREATDNLMECFRLCLCRDLPKRVWLSPTQVTNTLFAFEQSKWAEEMRLVVDTWEEVKVAGEATHQIFMFAYGYVNVQKDVGNVGNVVSIFIKTVTCPYESRECCKHLY